MKDMLLLFGSLYLAIMAVVCTILLCSFAAGFFGSLFHSCRLARKAKAGSTEDGK